MTKLCQYGVKKNGLRLSNEFHILMNEREISTSCISHELSGTLNLIILFVDKIRHIYVIYINYDPGDMK